jgi:hypothetical protein
MELAKVLCAEDVYPYAGQCDACQQIYIRYLQTSQPTHVADPGCFIPDPGGNKAPDPGFGSATLRCNKSIGFS